MKRNRKVTVKMTCSKTLKGSQVSLRLTEGKTCEYVMHVEAGADFDRHSPHSIKSLSPRTTVDQPPASLRGDRCGQPSPTWSRDGANRPNTDHV